MKRIVSLWIFILYLIIWPAQSFGQTNAQKESEIQLLIISYQQNKYSNPTIALRDIKKAVKIAETVSPKNYWVSTKVLLGEYYDINNNTKLALVEFTEALTAAKEINDIAGIASCEYNLSILFYRQEGELKKKKALEHCEKAILNAKKAKDKFLLAKSQNIASSIYYELDELEKAEKNSINALILFRELKQRNRMAQSYLTLSRVNNKKDEFTLAVEYLDSAIAIFESSGNIPEMNNANLVKSEIFYRQKKYKKAISLAKKVEESPQVMSDQKLYALKLLYLINKAMNKSAASLDYLEASKDIQDSLFQLDRDRLMESVTSEVEAKNKLLTLEKEAKINELQLKENKYITWALIGVSILLLLVALISFLFYRQNKMKSEKEKIKLEQESIQLEQKLLRTQMNPHFIANSLAAIQGNIYKQDKEKSVTYLSKFAKLMRFILESSREKEVLLEKEIISLTNYLDLQKLLLEEKLNFTIEVSEGFSVDEYLIPPMLIQPFIENAIIHGIELKSEPGFVKIKFKKQGENLKVIIEDDGLGREKVNEIYQKRKSSHLSFSTNITNERIEKMNAESNGNISIKTKDVVIDGKICGTKVELLLPLKSVY